MASSSGAADVEGMKEPGLASSEDECRAALRQEQSLPGWQLLLDTIVQEGGVPSRQIISHHA